MKTIATLSLILLTSLAFGQEKPKFQPDLKAKHEFSLGQISLEEVQALFLYEQTAQNQILEQSDKLSGKQIAAIKAGRDSVLTRLMIRAQSILNEEYKKFKADSIKQAKK